MPGPMGIVKVLWTNEGPRMSHLVRDGLLQVLYSRPARPTDLAVEL